MRGRLWKRGGPFGPLDSGKGPPYHNDKLREHSGERKGLPLIEGGWKKAVQPGCEEGGSEKR